MRKDIHMPKVSGVELAVIQENKGLDSWKVYILNNNNFVIDNVLVSSKGYGMIDDEKRRTSILRHLIGKVEARNYALVEPIDTSVFKLTNEYWVSYYANNQLFDKKFVFVEGSIREENLVDIELIGKRGVLHA